jgi:hypothetical protein
MEHVQDPDAHFREVARVLKTGGTYCFRTPNQWHYFAIGSRLMPFTIHVRIANKLRGLSQKAHDPYPTYYRVNTLGRIRQLCHKVGLDLVAVFAIETEPSYGRWHSVLFYPMFLYERLVNSHSALKGLRASILGILRKSSLISKMPR